MKLLPSATDSSIIKPRTSVISVNKLVPNVGDKKAENQEKTIIIKERLTTIAGLLEGTLASKKKEENDKRKEEQQEKREKREAKLEKKPKDTGGKLDLPKVPGMSFLDRIIQFLMNILGGYLLYRLVEFAPLLQPILTGIMKVGEWLINFGGKILNAVVSFVDGAYAAYDWTRDKIENVFGEDAAVKFDELSSNLNKLLNGAFIAAMVSVKIAEGVRKQTLKDGAKRGFNNIKGAKGQAGRFSKGVSSAAARRYADTYGKTAAIRRFGEAGVKSLGGKYGRSKITNLGRKTLVRGLGKGGVKAAAKILKPIVKRVPLIGGIMEFVLSWISGDPIGKAAFRGIGTGLGAWLGGAIGTLFGPGIGTFIGGALGGAAGGELGGLLYDTIFKDKEPQSQPTEVQGRQEGGQIKPLDTPKKPSVKPTQKLGSKRKTSVDYKKGKKDVSQIKVSEKSKLYDTAQTFNKIDFFGPVLASASKIMSGDDLQSPDFKNIGAGINNLLIQGFQDKKLKNNLAIAYADGGIVSADSLKSEPVASDNFVGWVGDTFKNLYTKAKPKLQESTKKEKKETKKDREQKTATQTLEDTLKSMLGISDNPDDGSTYGPGSVATLRDSATGVDISTEVPQVADGEWGSVLDLIYKYEAGPGGYESMFPSTTLPGATKMTIAEVASKATGAVGAWQNLPRYLNERARAVGLDPSTALYDKENQEKIAVYLIGRGQANVTKDMARKNPKEAMLRLSKVWAAIPKDDSGVSYYAGVGNNAAYIKPQQMYNAFQRLQFGGKVDGPQGIDKVPAMLTEGEFVIDKDSTMAIQTAFPGFLSAINKAEGQKAVEILMNYASYNDPTAAEVVIIDRKEIIEQEPMKTLPTIGRPSSSGSNFKEILSFLG